MRAGYRNQEALLNDEKYKELFKLETFYRFQNETEKAEEARRQRIELEAKAKRKDKEELNKELEEEKEKTLRKWGIK